MRERYTFSSDQFSSVQLSRFGGRLHIDLVGSEVEKSFAIVEAGEKLRWFVVVVIVVVVVVIVDVVVVVVVEAGEKRRWFEILMS